MFYSSALIGRVSSDSIASSTLSFSASTAATAAEIGMSTFFSRAISSSTGAVNAPSASLPCAARPASRPCRERCRRRNCATAASSRSASGRPGRTAPSWSPAWRRRRCRSAPARQSRAWSAPPRRWRRARDRRRCRRRSPARSWPRRRSRRRARRSSDRAGSVPSSSACASARGDRFVGRRERDRRRQAARHVGGKARAGQDRRHRIRRAFGDDLGHEFVGAVLDALGAGDQRRAPARCWRQRRRDRAHRLRRHHQQDRVGRAPLRPDRA